MSSLTIQWTKEEAAYLGEFQALCDKHLDEYKKQEEPEDPTRTFWTCNVDTKFMKQLGGRFPDIQRRMEGGDWEYWRRMYLGDGGIRYRTNQLEKRMKAHFAVVGYDYENIPPAPEMDHDTPIKVKYWLDNNRYFASLRVGNEPPYETVRMVGQVIIQTSLYNGTKTWRLSDACTGKLFPYKQEQSGSREIKNTIDEMVLQHARDISRLTDWSLFTEDQDIRVRRAITKRLRELKEKWGRNGSE